VSSSFSATSAFLLPISWRNIGLLPTPTFVRISCAREIRGDFTFGEQILDIADNTADNWQYNDKTGKLSVNKEFVLRSKIRIEARQFHMSRPHPQQWGDCQQLDVRDDWSLLN
jgi:hypothetical protein